MVENKVSLGKDGEVDVMQNKIVMQIGDKQEEQAKEYERVIIEEGPATGTFLKFNAFRNQVWGKEGEYEDKIAAEFEVEGTGGKVIPMYFTPKIVGGSKKYKPSNLYVLLEKASLLEAVKKANPLTVADVISFLEANLVGRKASVAVKNTKSDNPRSVVRSVFKFL